MNERILELARKAGLKSDSETGLSPAEQAFADLLMAEVLEVLKQEREGWDRAGRYRYEDGDWYMRMDAKVDAVDDAIAAVRNILRDDEFC